MLEEKNGIQINDSIYAIHSKEVSYGILQEFNNNFEMKISCSSIWDVEGSPILSLKTNKLIGIIKEPFNITYINYSKQYTIIWVLI